jgi:hypothetical protein
MNVLELPYRRYSPCEESPAPELPWRPATGTASWGFGHSQWWYITLFRAPLEHADGPADACGLPTALTGPGSPCGRQS